MGSEYQGRHGQGYCGRPQYPNGNLCLPWENHQLPNFGVSPSMNDYCQLGSGPGGGSNNQTVGYLDGEQKVGYSESE